MRNGMKVWATDETWNTGYTIGPRTNLRTFKHLEQFQIGTFIIKSFPVAHTYNDGEPCDNAGFIIYSTETKEKMLWITDASYIEYRFPVIDYICIECNYIDIDDYGDKIQYINKFVEKRRFNSHLSLNRCIQFLENQNLIDVKEIRLLHISHSQGKNVEKVILEKLQERFPNVKFVV